MVTLQPLWHRDKMCIAMHWQNNNVLESVVRNFTGRFFSIRNRCWYIPYSQERPNELRTTLEKVSTVVVCDNEQK